MRKKAIMSVSFGTNDRETSKKNIDVLEELYKKRHPECTFYRVFTNDAVIDLYRQEGDPTYAVRECIARMILDDVTHVYVQPQYILNGSEYDALKKMISEHTADFISVKLGAPLLNTQEDGEKVVEAIREEFADLPDDEALVLISHGSDHHANTVYCALDYLCKDLGSENYHIGTFNAYPRIDTVIKHLKKSGVKKVHVAPFMFVAGKSAMEGVCGDAEDSMKSRLEQAGFEVEAHRKCLGEYAGIRRLFAEHLDACFED